MRLTDNEYVMIQSSIDLISSELSRTGMHVTIEDDFAGWAAFMETAPGIASVSSTFDPRHSNVAPTNAFWIAIRDADDAVIGCDCLRLFETDDFIELIRSYRLFFDRKPVLWHHPLRLLVPRDMPQLAGRVVYVGGLWVSPDHRGSKLSTIMPRLARAFCLRHFAMDWLVGFVRDSPGRAAMGRERFGSMQSVPCINGYFPPQNRDAAYRLNYTSRWQALEQIRALAEAAEPQPVAPPSEVAPKRRRYQLSARQA